MGYGAGGCDGEEGRGEGSLGRIYPACIWIWRLAGLATMAALRGSLGRDSHSRKWFGFIGRHIREKVEHRGSFDMVHKANSPICSRNIHSVDVTIHLGGANVRCLQSIILRYCTRPTRANRMCIDQWRGSSEIALSPIASCPNTKCEAARAAIFDQLPGLKPVVCAISLIHAAGVLVFRRVTSHETWTSRNCSEGHASVHSRWTLAAVGTVAESIVVRTVVRSALESILGFWTCLESACFNVRM